MSLSNDPGHFFQTDASEAARARRVAKSKNKNGEPIVLKSKILSILPDALSEDHVYIAESGGLVRKISIESKDTATTYKGPPAPVTSIAIGGSNSDTIFAGCWDKSIWSWDRESGKLKKKYIGHSDFVKAVVCTRLSQKDVLISGGADGKIMVWDITSGERLHTLRDKADGMMAVQQLAIDPIASTPEEVVLFSSSSDPHIRRWKISLESASQISKDEGSKAGVDTIREHETSVYALYFDTDDEEGDLWTASADGTVKCLSRMKDWETNDTLEHGDYVRAVLSTPDWVITAGRSEDIKVWEKTSGKLYHTFEGHYEEVTGLTKISRDRLVSVSIDGTIRHWPLRKVEIEEAKAEARKKAENPDADEDKPAASMLTAEEEAELAELMDDSD